MARIAGRSVAEGTRREPQAARPRLAGPIPAVLSRSRKPGLPRLRAGHASAFPPEPCLNAVIRVARSFEPRRVCTYPRVYQ